jgi:formate dehydrogenase maturation protein FdhE
MDNEKSVAVTIEKLGEFCTRQDKCPSCKSKSIKETDPPENGVRFAECNICDYHWMETLS